jgi:phosphosulfolactate synthase (CoM biosynthesis protein A)
MEIIAFQKNNEALIQHFKKLGCYSIEVSDNFVQFWFTDVVIHIDKNKDNEINYYVSQLE